MPNSATWFDRITGVLRPIDRSLRAYQIAAACVLLIVVIVASASHMGMIGNGNQSAISNDQVIAEGFPVAVDSPQPGIAAVSGVDAARGAAIEDLVLRHENYEMSKPLGPDAGVRFVSRTSY